MDPVKVILPAWRRGDGKQGWPKGWYAVRKVGCEHVSFELNRFGETFRAECDYAGPIEFIETEPEPEPFTLKGHTTKVVEDHGFVCVSLIPLELSSPVIRLSISSMESDKAASIKRFNAAVKAMEGK